MNIAMMVIPLVADPLPLLLPLIGRRVPAGFPSPADDYLEGEIDLARYLVERPAASFMIRVSGSSMSGAGILDGDLLVVDRSLEAWPGHVVIAVIAGEMTVKRFRRSRDGQAVLRAEHPGYPEIIVCEEHPAEMWGVVVGVVRKLG